MPMAKDDFFRQAFGLSAADEPDQQPWCFPACHLSARTSDHAIGP